MEEIEQVKCRKCHGSFEYSILVFNKHLHMCLDCVDVWTEKMEQDRNFINKVFKGLDQLHAERKEAELILE